jgi:hypothetical protein
MKKNIDNSDSLGRAVRARPKQCYANAWNAIETQDEYRDATYVEGVAVLKGLVREHGWIEHDGEIIDPTLLDETMAYFPGLRFSGRDGLKSTSRIPGLIECRLKLPIFYRFGWSGEGSREFRKARVDAYHFLGNDEKAEFYAKYAPTRRCLPLKVR